MFKITQEDIEKCIDENAGKTISETKKNLSKARGRNSKEREIRGRALRELSRRRTARAAGTQEFYIVAK